MINSVGISSTDFQSTRCPIRLNNADLVSTKLELTLLVFSTSLDKKVVSNNSRISLLDISLLNPNGSASLNFKL